MTQGTLALGAGGWQPRRVAVFRALQLGDMLVAVPALRALRAALPDAEVSLIGLPGAQEFVARFSGYLDRFFEFPGYPGLPERSPDLPAIPFFIARMREERFDLLIQMHGSGAITNPLVASLGARRIAGYHRAGDVPADPDSFMPYPEEHSEIHTHLQLMRFLGVPAQGDQLELPLTEADHAEARRLWLLHNLAPRHYVCMHVGAQLPSRRWPAERFAAVGDALNAAGVQVVLTGTAAERSLTSSVVGAMQVQPVNLAGETSLGGLGALLADARLVVCNDTGVSHVAAALRVPSVVVASGSDVARWRPLDRERHRVLWHAIDCRPCAHATCPIGHPCALAISTTDVLGQVEQVLGSQRSPIVVDRERQSAAVSAGSPPWRW